MVYLKWKCKSMCSQFVHTTTYLCAYILSKSVSWLLRVKLAPQRRYVLNFLGGHLPSFSRMRATVLMGACTTSTSPTSLTPSSPTNSHHTRRLPWSFPELALAAATKSFFGCSGFSGSKRKLDIRCDNRALWSALLADFQSLTWLSSLETFGLWLWNPRELYSDHGLLNSSATLGGCNECQLSEESPRSLPTRALHAALLLSSWPASKVDVSRSLSEDDVALIDR